MKHVQQILTLVALIVTSPLGAMEQNYCNLEEQNYLEMDIIQEEQISSERLNFPIPTIYLLLFQHFSLPEVLLPEISAHIFHMLYPNLPEMYAELLEMTEKYKNDTEYFPEAIAVFLTKHEQTCDKSTAVWLLIRCLKKVGIPLDLVQEDSKVELMRHAVRFARAEVVELLLECYDQTKEDSSSTFLSFISMPDSYGWTLWRSAIVCGRVETFKLFLKKLEPFDVHDPLIWAMISREDKRGCSILHSVAHLYWRYGAKCVDLLLSKLGDRAWEYITMNCNVHNKGFENHCLLNNDTNVETHTILDAIKSLWRPELVAVLEEYRPKDHEDFIQ